ncbi:MAG: hypothetical protein WCT27_05590 [Patescibacteria group bacterium]
MSEKFEKSHEERDGGELKPKVFDVATWSGETLDKIIERAITKISQEPMRFRDKVRKNFELDAELEFDEALRSKVLESVRNYQEKFEAASVRFSEQAAECDKLARERGYLQTEPRGYSIVPMTELLRRGLPEGFSYVHTTSYDPNYDAVILDIDIPNAAVAHEVGHALSVDFQKKRIGVMNLELDKKTNRLGIRGARWIDEGLTVIWERMNVNDGSEESGRRQSGDRYGWAAEAVPLLLDHLGLDQEVGLKAYFGDAEARRQLDDAIHHRFNCQLDDLQCLGYKLDIEWTKKVLAGRPVHVTIKPGWHDTEIETLEKLTQIFPNVTFNENS